MRPVGHPVGGTEPERLGRSVGRPERQRIAGRIPELSGARLMRLYSFLSDQGVRSGRIEASSVVVDDDVLDIATLRAAPGVERPGKIVGVGLNYREHVAEGGRDAPPRPLLFAKFANAVIADGEPIVRPEGTHALDLEVELGVVIGRNARRVSRAEAMEHVAGYVVVNDVSARDWQGVPAALPEGERGDGQWLRAKGSDTFLPIGPVFVTADELDPRAGVRLRSWRITRDGEEHLMQDGSTADMIRDVPELIEYISTFITLDPGDVIATGTPSGVGVYRDPPVFLEPGDRVRCEIEGIGSVENLVIDWSEVARPAT
jgi:2-keto-4-pentenoate hydratase/2-oxohepta-3-ene-1,7-dioic acid hydratase in catechol pathway